MANSIYEVLYLCTDVRESLKLYEKALGFEVIEGHFAVVRLKMGTTHVKLLQVEDLKRPSVDTVDPLAFPPAGLLSIQVDDLAQTKGACGELGLKTMSESEDEWMKYFITQDRDGNFLKILQLK